MKNSIYIYIICLLFAMTSCSHCTKCVNNLAAYKNKIPYQNDEIVTFHNDTLGNRVDTINLEYNPPSSNESNCTGTSYSSDQNEKECQGYIYTYLKRYNFGLQIAQGPNQNKNGISYLTLFDNFEYEGINKTRDTVSYVYNKETVKAVHNKLLQSFTRKYNEPNIIEYFYSIDPKIMILQYTLVDTSGAARVWKLQ